MSQHITNKSKEEEKDKIVLNARKDIENIVREKVKDGRANGQKRTYKECSIKYTPGLHRRRSHS